jgi:hypothetical protein
MREELIPPEETPAFIDLRDGLAVLLEEARRRAARSVNALMTATYGEIGQRIVEYKQQGAERVGQGERLLERLSQGLTAPFKRGFSKEGESRSP